MKTANINLYSFCELSDEAKERAIEEHRRFLLDDMRPEDFISGDPEFDTPEALEEAYNSEYWYYYENDEPIIESIECNEYLFYSNGEFAPIRYKFPNHERREMYLVHAGAEFLLESIPFKTFPA